MTDKDTYDHDECSHLNRAKRAMESDLDRCTLDGGNCDCDSGCKLRDERITTLEAQKATIWDQYQAAVTSIDTLEARLEGMATLEQKRIARIAELEADKAKLEATVEHMDAICHTRDERIATLEATVNAFNERLRAEELGHKSCARELTAAKARIHELEKWPGL